MKITSKSKFSTHFMQIPFHLHPARQGAHPALSNSLYLGLVMMLHWIARFESLGFEFPWLVPAYALSRSPCAFWVFERLPSAISLLLFTDCYLRQGAHPASQGAGGTGGLHEIRRELACWGDFISVLKRISARNLKNKVCPSKNFVWKSKKRFSRKKSCFKK